MANTADLDPSAKFYTPLMLKFYDFIVLVVSNSWIWSCPTKSVLLPFYERHLASSEYHLDVGAGTGYYPGRALSKSKVKSVTLLDLNSHTIVAAKHRIEGSGYRGSVDSVEHNVFDTIAKDSPLREKFDSIALFYVLHCLPGMFPAKAETVARNLAPGLTKNGVFYGSTILYKIEGVQSREHNWMGRSLMNLYNKKGVFGNAADGEKELRAGLEAVFEEVKIDIVGMVALFVCKKPRK